MNDPKTRKRLMWVAAIAGAMLCALLFVSTFAPSGPSVAEGPVLRPAETGSLLPGAPGGATTPAETSGSGGFSLDAADLASLAWRLALVVVIIGASVAGLRWWGKKAAAPRSTSGFIRVVDTLAISNGRTIHLVALGDRVIAIGATPQQLSFLNELTGEEAMEVMSGVAAAANQPISQFAAELFQSMRRGTRHGAGPRVEAVIGADRD